LLIFACGNGSGTTSHCDSIIGYATYIKVVDTAGAPICDATVTTIAGDGGAPSDATSCAEAGACQERAMPCTWAAYPAALVPGQALRIRATRAGYSAAENDEAPAVVCSCEQSCGPATVTLTLGR
jgi:hypothetical protein